MHRWHLTLGHINRQKITRLVKDSILSFRKEFDLPQCGSCMKGKMTKQSFNANEKRTQKPPKTCAH